MVATGLAVLSTSAFATKARLQALGQDGRASFFLDDSRSVFLNPAKLNSMNNYVVTEWGTADDAADSETNSHAEGGFFRKADSFAYGLYLGNEYGANNATKTGASMQASDNNIDLFLSGNMGVEWGLRAQYSSSENKPTGGITTENDVLGLGLGVVKGNVEGYANLLLKDESKGGDANDDKYEADMGMNLGASYGHGNYTFYVDYDKSGYEVTDNGSKTSEVETTDMTFGVARKHQVSDSSMMFVDLNYNNNKTEDKKASTETTTTTLPLTVGFEAEATSWLKLRGSISQNIVIGNEDKKDTHDKSIANSTTVNAGATMTFGKLMVDGVIGSTNGARNTTTYGDSGKEGVLTTDNLMTRVAVHYWF